MKFINDVRLHFWYNGGCDVKDEELQAAEIAGCLPAGQLKIWMEQEAERNEVGVPHQHLVTYEGKPAMALGAVFNLDRVSSIVFNEEGYIIVDRGESEPLFDPMISEVLFSEMMQYAKEIEEMFPGVTALVGKNTDPMGHEFRIVVPFSMRYALEAITEEMRDFNIRIIEKTKEKLIRLTKAFLGIHGILREPTQDFVGEDAQVFRFHFEPGTDDIVMETEITAIIKIPAGKSRQSVIDELKDSTASYCDSVCAWTEDRLVDDVLRESDLEYKIVPPAVIHI